MGGAGVPLGDVSVPVKQVDFEVAQVTTKESPRVVRLSTSVEKTQSVCLDTGHYDAEVDNVPNDFRYTAYIRARGAERRLIQEEEDERAQRSVVDQTFGWMNMFRLSLVRPDNKAASYVALLRFACSRTVGRSIWTEIIAYLWRSNATCGWEWI